MPLLSRPAPPLRSPSSERQPFSGVSMRYKAWRSGTDTSLYLICRDGEFETLPQRIRALGPWSSREGELDRLKLHYRLQIAEQGFTIVHRHVLDFSPEPS